MASDGVDGLFHPAHAAAAVAARLTIDTAGVARVEAAGETLATAGLGDLEISDRLGTVKRRIGFPDEALFETADNDGVDRLLGRKGPGLIAGLERFHPRLILMAALVVAFGFAIYRYAVPALVEVAVAITPPAVPMLMSQGALESLDATVFTPTGLDKERQHALLSGFNALSAAAPRGPGGYVLNFRGGGAIGPNAFALPDGNVVLTDELVALAKTDDDMILGVLAHEIGHVEHADSLRRLYRAAGLAGLIMLIGGDLGSGTEDILVQGAGLAALSYSREQEANADRYSVELMIKAGRDPGAIARFFHVLEEELHDKDRNDFFSTHPDTPGRIEDVERWVKELTGKG